MNSCEIDKNAIDCRNCKHMAKPFCDFFWIDDYEGCDSFEAKETKNNNTSDRCN